MAETVTASDALDETWRVVLGDSPSGEGYFHRRVPLSAILPVHAGIHRPSGHLVLVLETNRKNLNEFELMGDARGYLIDVFLEKSTPDERAFVRIREVNTQFREIFKTFCVDLLEDWCSHSDAAHALSGLSFKLERWRKFFQRERVGLSREEYIGLYGELSFVEQALTNNIPVYSLLGAWQGPFGTNQDFLFGTIAAEIKTATGNAPDSIRIANVRQLDTRGLDILFLVHYSFDFRQKSGTTLLQIVKNLRERISTSNSDALLTFNDRLLDAGFVDAAIGKYGDWGFTLRKHAVFRVEDVFPRILEGSFPAGISEVSYTLNLSVADPFKIPDSDLWRVIVHD